MDLIVAIGLVVAEFLWDHPVELATAVLLLALVAIAIALVVIARGILTIADSMNGLARRISALSQELSQTFKSSASEHLASRHLSGLQKRETKELVEQITASAERDEKDSPDEED